MVEIGRSQSCLPSLGQRAEALPLGVDDESPTRPLDQDIGLQVQDTALIAVHEMAAPGPGLREHPRAVAEDFDDSMREDSVT